MAEIPQNNQPLNGMNKDMGFLTYPDGYYFDAMNFVRNTADGDFGGVTNELGHTMVGKFPDKFTCIGSCVLEDQLIIFLVDPVTGEEELGLGYNDTYSPLFNINDTTTTVHYTDKDGTPKTESWLNSSKFNFNVNFPIRAVARKIFNNNRVVYWVDGSNESRFYNLDKPNALPSVANPTPSLPENSTTITSQVFPKIDYIKQIKGGSLHAGAYYFAIRYVDQDLTLSFASNLTAPVFVVPSLPEVGAWRYVGGLRGTPVSKTIQLDITGLDVNYAYYELIYVTFEGETSTMVARVFERKKIQSEKDTILFNDDTKNVNTDFNIAELALVRASLKAPLCIEQKDNHLLLANFKTDKATDLQKIANRISIKYKVKEFEYRDCVFGIHELSGSGQTSSYVNLINDNKSLIIRANQPLSTLPSVNYVKLSFTNGVLGPLSPLSGSVAFAPNDDKSFIATFSDTGFNLTDSPTINSNNVSILDTANANHQPLYVLVIGQSPLIPGSVNGTYANGSPTQEFHQEVLDLLAYTSCDDSTIVFPASHELAKNTQFYIYSAAPYTGGTSIVLGDKVTNTPGPKTNYYINDFDNFTVASTNGTAVRASILDSPGLASSTGAVANDKDFNLISKDYLANYKSEKFCFDYTGYKRDEVYSFAIRLVYKDGGKSPWLHIPGRDRSTRYDLTKNNRTAAVPTLNQGYANAEGWLGTFISSSLYEETQGYPSRNGTGLDFSEGDSLRLHLMPSNKQEPFMTFRDGSYKMRVLGVGMCYERNGGEYSISEILDEFPDIKLRVQSIEFGRQLRNNQSNRSIFASGMAFPLRGITNGKIPFTSQPPMFNGRFDLNLGNVIRNLNSQWTGSGYIDQRFNLNVMSMVAFYSPDMLLLKRELPSGASLRMAGVMEGSQELVYDRGIERKEKKGDDYTPRELWGMTEKDNTGFEGITKNMSPILNVFLNYNCLSTVSDTIKYYKDGDAESFPYKITSPSSLDSIAEAGSSIINSYKTLPGGVQNTVEVPFAGYLSVNTYGNSGMNVLLLDKQKGFQDVESSDKSRYYIPDGQVGSGQGGFEHYYYFFNGILKNGYYDVFLDNKSQYGTLDSMEFVAIDTFSDALSVDKNYTVFKGDTFIGKCSYRNQSLTPIGAENNYKKGSILDSAIQGIINPFASNFTFSAEHAIITAIAEASAKGKVPIGHTAKSYERMFDTRIGWKGSFGLETASLYWFPCESDANPNYRMPSQIEGQAQTNADYFFPYNPIISVGDKRGRNENGRVATFYGVRGVDSSLQGCLDVHFTIPEVDAYNPLYSSDAGLDAFSAGPIPTSSESVYTFANRVVYSEQASEEDRLDSYRIFRTNNYHDVPKNKGAIMDLFSFNNILYIHTAYTLFRSFFNESTALQANDSYEVYLGTGGLFPRPSLELYPLEGGYAGTQSKWGSVTTIGGRVFVDYNQKKVFVLNGEGVGELQSFCNRFMLENIGYKGVHDDNPFIGNGYTLGYDHNNSLLYIHKHGEDPFTLSYSFDTKNYMSFHSYSPNQFKSLGKKTYLIDNDSKAVYQAHKGVRGMYLGKPLADSNITFVQAPQPLDLKTFDNMMVACKVYDEVNKVVKHKDFFDTYQVKTDFGITAETPLTVNLNFKQYSDVYNLTIPRSITKDSSLPLEDPSNQDANALFRSRLKGKYMLTTFKTLNTKNFKIILYNVVSLFRSSITR